MSEAPVRLSWIQIIWDWIRSLFQPSTQENAFLYIGHISRTKGSIEVENAPRDVLIWGEILFYGHIDQGNFRLEQVGRVALYGSMVNSIADDQIGVFSLAGPPPDTQPDISSDGMVVTLVMDQHYRALPARHEYDDATFPEVEKIVARLVSKQQGQADMTTISLEINLTTSRPIEGGLGILQSLTLPQTPFLFRRAGTESAQEKAPHNSLSGCVSSGEESCPSDREDCIRAVNLKFINITNIILDKDDPAFNQAKKDKLETDVQTQITDACDIWRDQVVLDLVVEPEIEDAPSLKRTYRLINGTTEADNLPYAYKASLPKPPPETYLEIFLVDGISYTNEGGDTRFGGKASTCCILVASRLDDTGFEHLLAHELGHALGLSHPSFAPNPGSAGSILVPIGQGITDKNSVKHCNFLKGGNVNPLVYNTGLCGCCDPKISIESHNPQHDCCSDSA